MKQRIAREKKWADIPAQGKHYFNDELIEKQVRGNADAECIEYLYQQIVHEDETALRRDPHYLTYSEQTGRKEAERRYTEMDDEQRKKILDSIVKVRQDEDMHRVINENYKKIRNDILEIFEYEGVSEFDEGEDGLESESPTTSGQPDAAAAQVRPQGAGKKEKQVILSVTKGENDTLRRITDALHAGGLSSTDDISIPGEYAVFAGTVEVFPHYAQFPYRIQVKDGIVYDIVGFDINTDELREALDVLEIVEDVPTGWTGRGSHESAAPAETDTAEPGYIAPDEDPTQSDPLDMEALMGDLSKGADFDFKDF